MNENNDHIIQINRFYAGCLLTQTVFVYGTQKNVSNKI